MSKRDKNLEFNLKGVFSMSMATSIAASATAFSSAQLQYNVSLSVTKKAMDSQEVAMQGLLEMMPQNPAGIGQNIDTYA